MAVKEYLHRTPTSTGNRHSWTLSFWVKRNAVAANQNPENTSGAFFNFYTTQSSSPYESVASFNADGTIQLGRNQSATDHELNTSNVFRDVGNWMHILIKWDVTKGVAQERLKLYVNGALQDSLSGSFPSQNYDGAVNTKVMHTIGTVIAGGVPYAPSGPSQEYFDYFLVDGQALDADVFGFYKDGDGYVSVGSTQATDFRPGQWSPHSPRKIKSDIERRGGFGVNGFYLPMNDSSNPGADFHCSPNSIIKLKGEDLPQPRNGAPTTSDAYVSQLRQETGSLGFDGVVKFDGSGDYLSLADNADFSFDGDFTIEAFVYPTALNTFNTIFSTENLDFKFISSGAVRIYTSSGSNTTATIPLYRWSHVALVRQSSTFKVYINGNGETVTPPAFTGDGSSAAEIGRKIRNTSEELTGFISNLRVVKGTALYTSDFTAPTEPLTNVTNTKLLCCNSSTSATAATVSPGSITANGNAFATRNELSGSIVLAIPGIVGGQGSGYGDYSADIKGSGSNKTITANGTANVVGGIDSHYGSALYSNTDGGFAFASSDFAFGTGDFTFECWFYLSSDTSAPRSIFDTRTSDNTNSGVFIGINSDDNLYTYAWPAGTGVNNIMVPAINQWHHVALERNGSVGTVYLNGVAVDVVNMGSTNYSQSGGTLMRPSTVFGTSYAFTGYVQDARVYKGVAKYKGGFDVAKPYAPVGIEEFRTVSDTCKNNFATLNPIFGIGRQDQQTYSDGNLKVVSSATSGSDTTAASNIAIKGKIYCEFALPSDAVGTYVGIMKYNTPLTNNGIDTTNNTNCWIMRGDNGNKANGEGVSGVSYGGAFSDGNIIMMAVDIDNGSIWWGRNGTWNASGNPASNSNAAYTNLPSDEDLLSICGDNYSTKTPTIIANYGQNPTFGNQFALNKNRINDSTADSVWHQSSNTGTHTDWTVSSGGTELDVTVPSGHYARVKLRSADGTIDLKKKYLLSFKYTTGPANLGVQNDQGYMTAVDGSVSPNGLSSGNFYSFIIHGTSEVIITGFTGSTYALDNVIVSEIDECYTDDSGKGKFHYQPPTGFLALCEDNLPTPAIADPGDHFKTVLYTGTGSSRAVTGVGFKPDFIWCKSRTNTEGHILFDSVRGPEQRLLAMGTQVEATSAGGVMSFDDDGYSTAQYTGTNQSGQDYVAWCWKAGGAAVTNTDGSINSSVSVNQTAGFSIVSYTGNGTSNATVGHGLNKEVKFMITKSRTTTDNWVVHTDATGTQTYSFLNTTAALTTDSVAAPTSSVFYRGTANTINGSNLTYVSYCWAEIEGYSKFGSYTGNGSTDGPFVYCGFKPAFVLVKSSTNTSNWLIMDNARNSTNPVDLDLYANLSNSETEYDRFDYVSNGFKVRNTSGEMNTDGATYIFMAFAESPFQTANAK